MLIAKCKKIMAKERDLDKIFSEYDAFLSSMGLGGSKEKPKPKPSTFGISKDAPNLLAKELDKSTFKRDNFMNIYRKIIISMYEANKSLMVQNGFDENEILELKASVTYSKFTKSDYCNIVSKLFRNKEIYQFFLTFLNPDVRKVFDALVWKETLSEEEVKNEIGVYIFDNVEKKLYGNRSHFEKEFRKEFMVFAVETQSDYDYSAGGYKKNFFIEIPKELRKVLIDYYDKPLHYNFVPLTEEPQTEFVASNESEIFATLPNLISYNKQGNIKTSGPGKVMANTLGKIRKTLNINELYPETAPKEIQQLKTYLLASMVVCEDKPKKDETFLGLLKAYLDVTYIKKYNSHTHILTSLKGGHNLYNVFDLETIFIQVLKFLPQNEWVSVQNIIDFTTLRGYEFKISNINEMVSYLTYETEGKYGKQKTNITKANYKYFTNEPFIKGNLMLWGCYGMLDLAYDTIDTTELGKTYFSVYDGLKAVRLTNLGAYLLGKTANYEAPEVKNSYELTFSSDNLIILVDGETNLTDILLANYADKVGSNRYAVSNESFLKNIANKKDLKLKVDIFKQIVSSNFPANWKKFFDELDRKVHPLKQLDDVMVFKIPSDDPELIKLLIQNQSIKKLLIKAEDYQIIVNKKDYPTLRTKLKTYGYLLN